MLRAAARDVLIVDPYMDERTLVEYVPMTNEGIKVRLLADAAHVKPALKSAVTKWASQYGAKRPLEARLSGARTLHDRLIIEDDSSAYALTQSLNAFAVRAPASILKVDADTAVLKLDAYRDIWATSLPL